MKKLALALVVGTMWFDQAAAATLIQSGTITAGLPGTRSFSVNQFNGALGTLNSIDLVFGANSTTIGLLTNTTARTQTYTLSRSVTAGISGNGFSSSATLLSGDTSFTINRFRLIPFNSGTAAFNYAGSGSGSQTLSSGFAPFIGTGTTTLNFDTTSSFSKGATPGLLTAVSLIGGEYALTYNYTAVPEPATWAMMIAGFAMIGFGLRSRRKQAVRVTYA
ncbi:choice-of-anchor E domain-containing protein [Novosphingobium sp.]|uniref:choice-of-anchor E domain-containing protein n=1 Tax=Novosphingobium sp. TaxID=1874826 RepID=UPI0025E5DDAA|nr:choice-of-anchor E domain-containing protein [Novosphingobium sp.]